MSSQEILPRSMRLDEFTPHLHGKFVADCRPKEAELTLVEAYPLKDRGAAERPPFILIFHSDPMTLLVDGIYVLRARSFDPTR